MIRTPELGLAVWNNGLDPYNSGQLGNNFSIIENHDHTAGKGQRISTAAIADGAITAVKIGAQQAWQLLTLTGSWSTTLKYFKDSLGIVHVRTDSITGPSGGVTANASLGTLPSGYRPVSTQYFGVTNLTAGTALAPVNITSAGVLSWGINALGASVPVAFYIRYRAEG